MHNAYSTAGYWRGDPESSQLAEWASKLRQEIQPHPVSLGLVFIPPIFFDRAESILDTLRIEAQVPLLIGCSCNSVIAGAEEIEDNPALGLGLFSLPGTQLQTVRLTQEQVEEWNGAGYWHLETGMDAEAPNGWLAFADPFTFDAEHWLKQWNEAYPSIPLLGGLASGDYSSRRTQIYINNEVHDDGGVALSIAGNVELASVISQGCTPIGETWTITKTDRNVIVEIGNRPAYQVLFETIENLPPDIQEKTRGNLFVGLAMNEYQDEFERGDFLVRNLLSADAEAGTLGIGAIPRPGQTIQFQRRDAGSSTEDITVLLRRAQNALAGRAIYGGCLCSCNGRGHRLFGVPHHDARHVQEAFGPMGLTGFFCNGEIGPIAGKNHLHGYTASLALFVQKRLESR